MLTINPSGNTPIYQQIIDQIREKVLIGLLRPGDKLPSVRELATMITINPNTIQKAYQELERQKIIVTVRGRGTFVSQDYKGRQDAEQLEALEEYFRKGILDARYLGLSQKDVQDLIDVLYKDLKARRQKNVKDN